MKHYLKLFVLLGLGACCLTGCEGGIQPAKEPVTYNITFTNYDDTTVYTTTVNEGEIPSCPVTPTKDSDSKYNYTFKEWNPTPYAADKDQTYVATYTQEEIPIPTYTITFKNYDGSVLETQTVNEGVVPTCSKTPTKPADDNYTYTFKSWNPTPYAANKNQEYTPAFSSKEIVHVTGTYTKVTEEPDEWNGTYLFVYEASGICLDGSLNKIDNTQNYKSVEINDETIEATDVLDKSAFTISEYGSGYAIQSASGYYIGGNSKENKIVSCTTEKYVNTLTIDSRGNFKAVSNNKTLKFNSQASRFRYYGNSTGTSIQLYCKDGSTTPVELEGISFEKTSGEVGVGRSVTLTPVYTPKNVSSSKKGVTWSTSNSNVATVSDGVVSVSKSASIGATATITATSTYNTSLKATYALTVVEQKLDSWTIMIYMCGSNLESDSRDGGLATSDLNEIKSVTGQPDDVNIIVQTGGASSWRRSALSGVSSSKSQRWHLENQKYVLDSSQSKVNMGLTSTLQSFLEWGLTEYPAEKTGVIFWNHGGGMYGCCYDEQFSDDCLTNKETKDAFNNAFSAVGRTENIEFIGYDACLMNVQDVAEFNSHYANYMVASEESEAGEGWDYDNWIDDLYAKKSTTAILSEICDTFIADIDDMYGSSENDQTLSVLDLSKMSTYLTAWENMTQALMTKFSSNTSLKSTFKSAVNKAKRFCVDSDQDEDYYALYDARDFLTKIKNNSSINPGDSYIDECINAFDAVVIHSEKGKVAGNANGMACFYAASSGYYGAYNYLSQIYSSTDTNFSKWRTFNNTYGG